MSIICLSSLALLKRANVERHFRTVHKQYENNYPFCVELRKIKVQIQWHNYAIFCERLSTKSETDIMASFNVADILLKHKKPIEDIKYRR